MDEEYLWSEKYRPKTIRDCILPAELKATFQGYVDKGDISNLLLTGSQGTGKTTVAKAMLEELGLDYIIVNGSMEGNIDTLRQTIAQFASTVSFVGGRKFVILDEADFLNPTSFQPALRGFIEEFSKNCGFILTCNYKHRIIEPLHSRCSVIDFHFKKSEYNTLAAQFYKRMVYVLKEENIEFDKAVVAELIKMHFPDNRRIINELQRYAISGKIDAGILTNLNEATISDLVKLLKDKDFTKMRTWVSENHDLDPNTLFRKLYDHASKVMEKKSIPQAVLILGRYQYQQAFSVDPEINLACCLTELMMDCEFK